MTFPLAHGARNVYANFIGGRDAPAADGRTFQSFNPTTGKV